MSKADEKSTAEPRCLSCNRTDREVALLPIRFHGEDKWICAKCLPRLIHG